MASLKEGEWSCYGGCHFNGRENGHVTEEVSIMEGEGGHVLEVASLKEGEWSCHRSGQFNGRSMVMLQRWSLK